MGAKAADLIGVSGARSLRNPQVDLARGAAYAGNLPIERRVRLFRIGRDQAVRIPREFALPGQHAIMRREGVRRVIEPARSRSLLAVLEPIEKAFPEVDRHEGR